MSPAAPSIEAPSDLDGVPIAETIAPESIDAAARLLADCHAAARAVFPIGGGVSLAVGLPPARAGIGLATTRLERVDDYPSEDMTITVEAGIRLQSLQRILAAKGQMLPLDAPFSERATLGGLLATAYSGPRRAAYGTPRDYVLGIDCLSADGTRVHGGGRVVKNVAGYDLMKLHAGAHGSLGVIVQATLKLRPLPEATGGLACSVTPDLIEPVLATINRAQIRPVAVELLGTHSGDLVADLLPSSAADRWQLLLLFEEARAAVTWQLDQAARLFAEVGARELIPVTEEKYARVLERLTAWSERVAGSVVFKANLLPSRLAEFALFAEQQLPGVRILAHAASGIAWGALPEDHTDLAEVLRGLTALRRLANAHSGDVVIPRCPTAWKASLPVWGTPRPERAFFRRLKEKLDPRSILNPGRFL